MSVACEVCDQNHDHIRAKLEALESIEDSL